MNSAVRLLIAVALMSVGSYLAASPLRVEKNRAGHYVVVKELPKTPACRITRG
ncbi:hypothetical protein K5F93_30035 [Pseudomonas protegens]|uniref:hypothetical protein n=1 Tax=Pseudomonas protegens TaxID=380021 RepID=UPI001C8E8DF7|nr:hypothetical protein [Pseudomonas protegens]QZI70523.1 hypothetical protein K5F93_30035 [Pseudomonas protegens]